MALTSNQTRLFDIYEQMFALDGWKELVEDFKERRDNLKETVLRNTKSERELGIAQGMNHIYSYIIELENFMEASKRQAMEQDKLESGALN